MEESRLIMERKKALLAVTGGRGVPDVLALLCVQPHLVIILTSEEGWRDEPTFREIADALPDLERQLPTLRVKSYDFQEVRQACIDACQPYPQAEWDWVISIGSCPKIMGIAAYEVAKEMNIPCIYIDTQHETIVSPVKALGISADEFFHMTVKDYMKIYRRERNILKPEKVQYRKVVEKWGNIARTMALSPDTPAFTKLMHDVKAKVPVPFPSTALATSSLLQELEGYGVIKTTQEPDGTMICEFTTVHSAQFLGTGDWLELYVWHEVKESGFANDYQWGYVIKSAADNEIDVVLTYRAQLIFAECKTNKEPFETKLLDPINSKAEMLGGPYVTKIFVTNASKTQKGYANFCEQAKLRKIVVATAEDLPNIGSFLKKQAEAPDFPRM